MNSLVFSASLSRSPGENGLLLIPALLAALATLPGCDLFPRRASLEPNPTDMARRVILRTAVDHRHPMSFDWGEGVLISGMIRAGKAAGEATAGVFARTWANHWRTAGIQAVLEEKGYCGRWGPAFALVQLFEGTEDQLYLDLADQVGDFIDTQATRTADGAYGHWRGNHQLWIDTLYMAAPVQAALSRTAPRYDHLDEAVRQVRIFARRLQDPRTGLFRHMFDEDRNLGTDDFWARGNGWAAMSFIEVLRRLDRDSPAWIELRQGLRTLLDGLAAAQDLRTGLWHTVLDRPETYLETSASAMFLFAFIEGERLGLIERTHGDLIRRAWTGIASQVDDGGRVFGVSGDTAPTDLAGYADVLQGEYPWGTGAFLLAAGALIDWKAGR